MRRIKTIDDITKDGQVEFGEGYDFVEEAKDADAILMRSTDLHGYDLPESIRAIARCGAGVNNIPVREYAKRGVVVFNSPGANSNAVKEIVIAMMILSSRGIVQSMKWVRENAEDPDIFTNAEKAKKAFVGHELKGKRVGVVGLGNVGSKVANACVDLGMEVYGYDPFISIEHAWALSHEVQRVGTLEDLCRDCDYLTLHVPSKADTIGMIGTEQIDMLAPGAVLINFARETIINEARRYPARRRFVKSLPARLAGTDFAAAVAFELDMKAADGERVRAELTRVTDGRIEALLEEERFAPWEDAT